MTWRHQGSCAAPPHTNPTTNNHPPGVYVVCLHLGYCLASAHSPSPQHPCTGHILGHMCADGAAAAALLQCPVPATFTTSAHGPHLGAFKSCIITCVNLSLNCDCRCGHANGVQQPLPVCTSTPHGCHRPSVPDPQLRQPSPSASMLLRSVWEPLWIQTLGCLHVI